MSDLVEKALKLAADKEAAFPSAQVDRALDSENDLGNLLSWNENDMDVSKLSSHNEEDREKYLLEIARDNAQVTPICRYQAHGDISPMPDLNHFLIKPLIMNLVRMLLILNFSLFRCYFLVLYKIRYGDLKAGN